jgi:DNA-binding SARP family transcriptional activator
MIHFQVLGSWTLRADGADHELPGAMPGRLLALLLCRWGSPLPVDRIIEQLWPGQPPPKTAKKFIQVTIHRLRRLPGMRDRIVLSGRGYHLCLKTEECDALRFLHAVAAARGLADAGDPQAADRVFAEALSLWRTPAFAHFDDVPLVLDESRRLNELRLTVLEDHADIGLSFGRHLTMVEVLARAAAENPFRERLRVQLMVALYRSGRLADALRAYRDARDLMVAELGIEPEAPLQEMHRRILNRDPELLTPDTVPPSAAAPRPQRNFLPRGVPAFVGRQQELEWLDVCARDMSGAAVITSVAGMGGVGKTALMIRWAHQRTDLFPDGQLYVNLRGHSGDADASMRQALHHLLTCLGVPVSELPASLDDATASYRALLAGRRALVLVDDARTADQVRPLLPGGPGCFVVVTSRSSLTGLVACDGARQLTLHPMPDDDAMNLLRQLLGDERLDRESAGVAGLAEICGGLPLALRIAAAHLFDRPQLRVTDYVAELLADSPVAALTVDGDGHRGVKAVLDASLDTLPPSAVRVFHVIGAIPGSDFTRDVVAVAAAVSADEADAALATLVTFHFVEEGRPDRYTIHELLRSYSQDLLRRSGAPETGPLARVLDFYRHVASTALAAVRPGFTTSGSTPPSGDDRRWPDGVAVPATTAAVTAWFSNEHVNVAAAISEAAEHGMVDDVQALVNPLWQLCHHHGHVGRWIGTFEGVIAGIRRHGAGDAIVPVLNALGNAYVMAGLYERAAEAHAECVRAWTVQGFDVDTARARTNLAASLERMARYPEALTELRLALTTFERHGLAPHYAYVLELMSSIQQRQGHLTASRDNLIEALDLLRKAGLKADTARTLDALADVCVDLGHLDEAETYATEASRVAREYGNRHIETMTKATRALILRARGRYEESLTAAYEAHESFTALGIPGAECENLLQMGLTYSVSGRLREATQTYRRALTIAAGLGEKHLEARALLGIGKSLHGTDPADAMAKTRAALVIFETLAAPEAADARRILAGLGAAR